MIIDLDNPMVPTGLFWGLCWLWSLFSKPYEEENHVHTNK